MSALATVTSRVARRRDCHEDPGRLFAAVPEGSTLEDVLLGVWEDLSGSAAADCLVCDGPMDPRYGAAGATPVGGRCRDCGTTLD